MPKPLRYLLPLLALAAAAPMATAAPRIGPDSGLPVPRYESLKYGEVNGRQGPSTEHRLLWTYHRRGLPLEVVAESGPWRRVRDPDGDLSWIAADKLEERRTAFLAGGSPVPMRKNPKPDARPVAVLGPGMVVALKACRLNWRQIEARGIEGWIEVSALWGAKDCAGLPG